MTKGFLGDAEMPALDLDALPNSFATLSQETLESMRDQVLAEPMRSPHADLADALSAQIGMTVIVDPGVPDDKMWLIPHDSFLMGAFEHGAMIFRQEPTETRWQAVEIVHDGLADWVDYLRAHGHHLPDWEQQKAAQENRRSWVFEESLRLPLNVVNPSKTVTVTGLT